MANCDTVDDFTWGKAKGTSSKDRKYYNSFFYENEEYYLFDNVIVHDEENSDGHVAKIMKLWQDISSGTMMTSLRWFLKPHELPSYLQSQMVRENSKELFLAFGKGKGVSNENKLVNLKTLFSSFAWLQHWFLMCISSRDIVNNWLVELDHEVLYILSGYWLFLCQIVEQCGCNDCIGMEGR